MPPKVEYSLSDSGKSLMEILDRLCVWGDSIFERIGKDGLIIRKEYPQMPPKVEYSLSDSGKSLMEILDRLCVWGEIHKNDMK